MISTYSIIAAALAAAAEEATHGGDGGLLAPDYTLTIFTWITFLLFTIIIAKFGWGPLVKALDDREKSISDQIKRAEDARKEAESLLSSYQQKLDKAGQEADALIAQARTRAEAVLQKVTGDAKTQAAEIARKAQESIEAERLRAVTELRGIVAEASVSLAGKILTEELSPAKHAKLIDSVVAGIAASGRPTAGKR